MKILFPLAGLIFTLLLFALLDSPKTIQGGDWSNSFNSSDDDTGAVIAQTDRSNVPTYSSVEFILEGRKNVDGSILEMYREYEIYEDEDGNVLKKVPTSNFNYLTYESEHDHN